MIHLTNLLTTPELNKVAKDATGRAMEIAHKLFIDITIGDFIYLNSLDIFDVPFSDMLIQMMYHRFEQHVKENYHTKI